jgi:cell division septal protein FtsQ
MVLAVLACAVLVARHAPFLRVQDVRVAGVEGEQATEIRTALERAAKDMSTIAVREDDLRAAAEPYATVQRLEVERDLPRALRIEVTQKLPVAVIGGAAVGADARPLDGVSTRGLPAVRAGTHTARRLVRVLAAAPRELLGRAAAARATSRGIEVELRHGPVLRFGDDHRPRAKWLAATAVLADERSHGAEYVDVGVPERPTAGGAAPDLVAAEPSGSTSG